MMMVRKEKWDGIDNYILTTNSREIMESDRKHAILKAGTEENK